MIKVGLVCSSGGAVFGTAYRLLKSCGYDPKLAVITDRPCGAESLCDDLGVPWKRIEDPSRVQFSTLAANWLFDEQKVEWTGLFFTRLVSQELFSRAPCINFHPSLLPAFPGFGALKAIQSSGSRFVGATAHCVDDSTDGGPILAQVVAPVHHPTTIATLERISFAQKLYLLLVMCELAERGELLELYENKVINGAPALNWANPALKDQALALEFDRFIADEEIPWQR
jgi:phosphoribosylglycinamide formyltransferase-1